MEDQIISFNTARLAKEKGFSGLCYNYYEVANGDPWLNHTVNSPVDYNGVKDTRRILFSAPTQGLLQKWIREVHGVHVLPRYRKEAKMFHYHCRIYAQSRPSHHAMIHYVAPDFSGGAIPSNFSGKKAIKRGYWSYEEALEECLKYALQKSVSLEAR